METSCYHVCFIGKLYAKDLLIVINTIQIIIVYTDIQYSSNYNNYIRITGGLRSTSCREGSLVLVAHERSQIELCLLLDLVCVHLRKDVLFTYVFMFWYFDLQYASYSIICKLLIKIELLMDVIYYEMCFTITYYVILN